MEFVNIFNHSLLMGYGDVHTLTLRASRPRTALPSFQASQEWNVDPVHIKAPECSVVHLGDRLWLRGWPIMVTRHAGYQFITTSIL